MHKRKYICNNCKTEPISCDSGWGHEFKKNGMILYCKKTKRTILHYCNESEMESSIIETARGDADYGRELRSFGKEAHLISSPLPAKRK